MKLNHYSLLVATQVTCLGVVFDCELTFSKHVTFVVRRCFYHLRQIRAVRKSLTTESVKTLIHAVIASQLDNCNSVFYQLSAAKLQALQSVLNSGARLIMRKRKNDHSTSLLLDDLHWLPIRQRILYKLYTIVYKCIHGAAPSYLTNLCVPVATNTSRRYLRSATHGDLLVPMTRTMTYGSFAVSGPTVWNTLPSTLRVLATTLGQFRSRLKTILFHLPTGHDYALS